MPSSRGSSQPGDQTCNSYVSCRLVLYHLCHLGSPEYNWLSVNVYWVNQWTNEWEVLGNQAVFQSLKLLPYFFGYLVCDNLCLSGFHALSHPFWRLLFQGRKTANALLTLGTCRKTAQEGTNQDKSCLHRCFCSLRSAASRWTLVLEMCFECSHFLWTVWQISRCSNLGTGQAVI